MKEEKGISTRHNPFVIRCTRTAGITLISLVVYIALATIVIGIMATVSSYFFSNMNLIKNQDQYAVEFNKFNMFFINDIKKNKVAQIEETKITFPDGNTYTYKQAEKAVYRNDIRIAKEIEQIQFSQDTYQVNNTTKTLINVHMSIGKNKNFDKTIEYVLKYW